MTTSDRQIAERIAALDWPDIEQALEAHGCATLRGLLNPRECVELTDCYDDGKRFRSKIVMARHGFGQGEYQYFAYPLPEPIATLRKEFYSHLVPIANRWSEALDLGARYSADHGAYLACCRRDRQTHPTPLLLRYGQGDYNCLHQDLYGEHVFPLQVTFLLSQPRRDFTGGEFVLTEQRPRMQSRAEVVLLERGDGVIFPVRHRPVHGKRGWRRVSLRHGVSRLHSGERFTLGIIFHDAR